MSGTSWRCGECGRSLHVSFLSPLLNSPSTYMNKRIINPIRPLLSNGPLRKSRFHYGWGDCLRVLESISVGAPRKNWTKPQGNRGGLTSEEHGMPSKYEPKSLRANNVNVVTDLLVQVLDDAVVSSGRSAKTVVHMIELLDQCNCPIKQADVLRRLHEVVCRWCDHPHQFSKLCEHRKEEVLFLKRLSVAKHTLERWSLTRKPLDDRLAKGDTLGLTDPAFSSLFLQFAYGADTRKSERLLLDLEDYVNEVCRRGGSPVVNLFITLWRFAGGSHSLRLPSPPEGTCQLSALPYTGWRTVFSICSTAMRQRIDGKSVTAGRDGLILLTTLLLELDSGYQNGTPINSHIHQSIQVVANAWFPQLLIVNGESLDSLQVHCSSVISKVCGLTMESAVNVQTYNALVCVAILDVLCGAVEDINANQDTRKILCPLSIAMRSLPSETIHQFVQLYLSQQGKTRGERPKVNVLLILLDILQFKIAVDAEGSPTIELVNLLRFCSPLFNDGKMDSTEEGETARNLKNLLSVVFSSSERCYKTMGRLIGTLARDIEEAEALFGNELALTICNSNLALIQLGLDSMDATLRDYVIAQSIQQRKLEHDRTVEPTAVQSFRHKVFVLFISQGARHVQAQTGSQEHSQFLEDYLKGVYFPSIGVPQKVQTYAQQCDTRVIQRSFDSLRRHLVEHTNPPRWDMALRILAAHASDVPLLAVPTGSKKKWTPLSQEEHSAFMDKMKEIAKAKDIKKAVALLYDYERDKRVLSLSEFEMAVSVSVPRGPLVFGEHMVDYAMTCGYHSKTVGMCALNCSYRVYTKLEKMKRSRHTGAEEQQDILFKQFSCRQLALRALRLLPELYTQNVRSTGMAEIIPDEGILSESECKRLLHYIRALHNEDEQQVLHCCTEAHVFNAKVLRDARDSLYQQLKLCKMVEDTEGIVRGYLEFRNCYSRMPISSEQLLQILEACVELSSDVSKESDVVPEGGTGGDFTKREELKHVVVLLSRDAFDFLRWDAAGESTASELGKHSVIRAKFNNLVKRWFDVLFAGAVTDTGREKFTVVVVGALQAVLEHIQTVSNQLQCFDEEVLLTCVGAVKRGFQYRDSSTGLESIKNCARLLQQWSSDRGQAEALFVSKWIEKLASAQMARCSSSILILHDDLVLERHKVAREEVNNFFQHPEGTLLAKLEVMCFALQHHLCWFESSSKVSRLVLLDSAVNHVNGLLGDVASQWSPKEVLLCFHRAVSLLNSFRGELLLAEVSINGEGDVYSIHSYIMKMQTRSGDNVENLLVNGWYAYWEEEKGGVTLQDNEFCRLFIGVQFWVTFYSWKHHNGRGSVVWDALRAWYNDRQEMLTREESFTMACCLAVFDSNVSVVSDFSDVISDALAKEIPSEVHPLTRMGLSLLIVKRMFAPCVNSSFCQEWSETQRAHFVAIVYSTSPSLDGLQPLLSTELLNVLMDSPMFFSWMLYLFAEGNRAFDNKDQISTSETVNIFHLASFCRGAFLLEKSPLSEENFNRAVNTVCFFYPSRVDLLCFLIFRFPLCGTEDSVFRVIADRIKTVQAVCEDATLCGLASYVSSLMASSGEQCTSATETGASLKGPLSRPIASLQTKVSLFHSSEYANGETNLVHQPVQLYGLNFTVQHTGCPPALVDGTRATYIPPSTSLAAVYLTTAQLLTAHSTPSAKVESLLARIAVLSNTDDLSTILQSLAMEDAITVDDLSTAWTCLLDRLFAFAVADSTEYLNTCVDAYTAFLNCLEFCANSRQLEVECLAEETLDFILCSVVEKSSLEMLNSSSLSDDGVVASIVSNATVSLERLCNWLRFKGRKVPHCLEELSAVVNRGRLDNRMRSIMVESSDPMERRYHLFPPFLREYVQLLKSGGGKATPVRLYNPRTIVYLYSGYNSTQSFSNNGKTVLSVPLVARAVREYTEFGSLPVGNANGGRTDGKDTLNGTFTCAHRGGGGGCRSSFLLDCLFSVVHREVRKGKVPRPLVFVVRELCGELFPQIWRTSRTVTGLYASYCPRNWSHLCSVVSCRIQLERLNAPYTRHLPLLLERLQCTAQAEGRLRQVGSLTAKEEKHVRRHSYASVKAAQDVLVFLLETMLACITIVNPSGWSTNRKTDLSRAYNTLVSFLDFLEVHHANMNLHRKDVIGMLQKLSVGGPLLSGQFLGVEMVKQILHTQLAVNPSSNYFGTVDRDTVKQTWWSIAACVRDTPSSDSLVEVAVQNITALFTKGHFCHFGVDALALLLNYASESKRATLLFLVAKRLQYAPFSSIGLASSVVFLTRNTGSEGLWTNLLYKVVNEANRLCEVDFRALVELLSSDGVQQLAVLRSFQQLCRREIMESKFKEVYFDSPFVKLGCRMDSITGGFFVEEVMTLAVENTAVSLSRLVAFLPVYSAEVQGRKEISPQFPAALVAILRRELISPHSSHVRLLISECLKLCETPLEWNQALRPTVLSLTIQLALRSGDASCAPGVVHLFHLLSQGPTVDTGKPGDTDLFSVFVQVLRYLKEQRSRIPLKEFLSLFQDICRAAMAGGVAPKEALGETELALFRWSLRFVREHPQTTIDDAALLCETLGELVSGRSVNLSEEFCEAYISDLYKEYRCKEVLLATVKLVYIPKGSLHSIVLRSAATVTPHHIPEVSRLIENNTAANKDTNVRELNSILKRS